MRKTLVAILALAIAIAFSPLTELQAATLGPDSKVQADSLTHVVKAKKAKKKGKKKRKGKRAKSKKGPGKCGAYMYWSKKKRRCMDARNK